MNMQGDDFEVGVKVIATEEPMQVHESIQDVVTIQQRSFFSEMVWEVAGVDLPFICIKPYKPPLRFDHLKQYVIDTRQYKFKKLSDEFVTVATEGR